MRYAYPVTLGPEKDGRLTVLFDELPGATWGDTEEEALTRAKDLLVSSLATFVEDNQPIPRPSPACGRPVVSVPALAAAKLALHDAMLEARLSNANSVGVSGWTRSRCAGCVTRCIAATSTRSRPRCASLESG